mmetsp:Transcript_22116/g.47729  ORF Transcript_22116/g.47729 Transcript_22116/m.47729 type:complete len:389 (-) Transcript_22116:204-1370(-)
MTGTALWTQISGSPAQPGSASTSAGGVVCPSVAYVFHGWLYRRNVVPLSQRGWLQKVTFNLDIRKLWSSHSLVIQALGSRYRVNVYWLTYDDEANRLPLAWAARRGTIIQPLAQYNGSTQWGTVSKALQSGQLPHHDFYVMTRTDIVYYAAFVLAVAETGLSNTSNDGLVRIFKHAMTDTHHISKANGSRSNDVVTALGWVRRSLTARRGDGARAAEYFFNDVWIGFPHSLRQRIGSFFRISKASAHNMHALFDVKFVAELPLPQGTPNLFYQLLGNNSRVPGWASFERVEGERLLLDVHELTVSIAETAVRWWLRDRLPTMNIKHAAAPEPVIYTGWGPGTAGQAAGDIIGRRIANVLIELGVPTLPSRTPDWIMIDAHAWLDKVAK